MNEKRFLSISLPPIDSCLRVATKYMFTEKCSFNCYYSVPSIEFYKTKTKVITAANEKGPRQQSKELKPFLNLN